MIHLIDLKFQGIQKAIASYLIETSIGPVLIETGPYSTFPTLKEGIEKAGYKVEDIKDVSCRICLGFCCQWSQYPCSSIWIKKYGRP